MSRRLCCDLFRFNRSAQRAGCISRFMLMAFLLSWPARGQDVRTQRIDLVPGWNAVFVEIDPIATAPADLLKDLPVDVVAGFSSSAKPAQFVADPSVDMLKTYGWNVWYSPRRADHFLSTLSAIQGGKPYLVHATTNAVLVIHGSEAPDLFQWTPDAFNFVGFPVANPGSPTFAEFFSGSPNHDTNKIYRMVNGTWRRVTDPAGTSMRSGESFWIYCDGSSSYKGPVEFSAGFHSGLIVSAATGASITMRNRSTYPITVTLEHITDAAAPVPLVSNITIYDLENALIKEARVAFDADNWSIPLPAMEAGTGMKLPLEIDRDRAGFSTRQSVIKATTDLGTIAYLPLTAFGLEPVAAEAQ